MTDNDLGIEVIDVSGGDAVALDPITRAEIDIAIATAQRFPRKIATFVDDVTSMATLDEETAAGCFYSIRRGTKTIQGPSVRLAEIAVSCWGNIRAGARLLGTTPDGRFVRAMGVCHDLEKNVYIAMEAQRRITTSSGQVYGDDMVGVTSNAAAAIAFRNAAFKVIPRAMLRSAFLKAKKVATGGAKTLREKREEVFERLAGLNALISPERILASIGRPSIEEVTLEDVGHLIGLGTAIRDGAQTVDEAFPEPETVTAEEVKPAAAKAEPVEEAPPPSTEKPKLDAKQIAGLLEIAAREPAVDRSAIEEDWGGPLDGLEGKAGETPTAFYNRVLRSVADLKKKSAK